MIPVIVALVISSLALLASPMLSDATGKTTDTTPRGATVPFTTIEAEAPDNRTTGQVIKMTGLPTRTTMTPELEASGRAYVELNKIGDYLDFSNMRAANTIVLRHCIPDAPTGDGLTATLSLYVNNTLRQSLTLSSKYNWLYGEAGQNGQSDDPAAGTPHVFWDETRFFIKDGVKQGDTIRLQKDAADTAAFYRVDSIDLETAPDPLPPPAAGTYLSVIDYGANGSDTADETAAIQACIAAAKEQKKIVWLPAGTYYQKAKFILDGVQLRGAGMWHTRLIGNVEETGWGGALGFTLSGDGPAVSDLFIESALHTRRGTPGGKPFTGAMGKCSNWRVENVWMTHTHVAFWMSGVTGGTVRGCRVRFTYADGININRGSRNNLVEHNHVRGTGDDGIALLSEKERTPNPSANNTVRSNTVIATWWGHNLDVAGGNGHVAENNLLADNPLFGCLTINLPGAYPMYPQTSATIRHNTILRGGGNYVGQRRGAIWIYAGDTTISDVVLADNEIIDPIFRGIHLTGSGSQSITFERNLIVAPGEDGIVIESKVKGSGVFKDNTVRDVKPGFQPFVNNGGDDYAVTATGNSWQ